MNNLYRKIKDALTLATCESCGGLGKLNDAEPGDMSFNELDCTSCGSSGMDISKFNFLLQSILKEEGVAEYEHFDDEEDEEETFSRELAGLINRYSLESKSNTPDFILAEYLSDCLDTFNKTQTRRSRWYNSSPINTSAGLNTFRNNASSLPTFLVRYTDGLSNLDLAIVAVDEESAIEISKSDSKAMRVNGHNWQFVGIRAAS